MSKSKTKRLRVFAGPNGSGKSTLAASFKKRDPKISLGVFVNADEIETSFNTEGSLSLTKYRLPKVTTSHIRDFIKSSSRISDLLNVNYPEKLFHVRRDKLYFKGKINSYIAAQIASFLRKTLLDKGVNFSFETVFSHPSKLDFMIEAKKKGYRIYFYFLTTDDPMINVSRVNNRVAKQGHPVPEQKIVDRYSRSLDLMYDAVRVSSRAYLFDNSGKYNELVAQINYGRQVEILDYDRQIPNWFIDYFYKKYLDQI